MTIVNYYHVMMTNKGYGSLSEAQQVKADMGMYPEFPMPGAIGMDTHSWMRADCNVIWEVCPLIM